MDLCQSAISYIGKSDAVINVFIAWFRLLILLRIPSEIASPAASSPARTILKPEDSFSKGLFQLSCFDPLISGSINGCYVILHLHDVSPSFVSSIKNIIK